MGVTEVKFDREEEKQLLEEWMASVQFDKDFKDIPEMQPEADDEGGPSGKDWMQYAYKLITPGGRIGSDARTGSRANRENWVEKTPAGELPQYIRIVRNGLMRQGHSESRATALAVAAMKRWARGGDHVSPKVQAAAARALAQWDAMKASR